MWPENGFYNIFNYCEDSGCISLLPAHKHFRGKGVALFLAMPFSRHEISPNPLALSVVSAMHLSVPSTPISHWANNFRSNETAVSIRHECCARAWLAAGKQGPLCRLELGWKRWAQWDSRKQWGFKSRRPNPAFNKHQGWVPAGLSWTKYLSYLGVFFQECVWPSDWPLHRRLYIRVTYFSIKSIFVLLLIKREENHQRCIRDPHHT